MTLSPQVTAGGLDLTVHSLVDSRVSLAEFMEQVP
jgi:hypothetical protein